MTHTLTVATANTHEGRMLKDTDGLKPFVENGVDALLMQEVLRIADPELRERLYEEGYELTHFDSLSGLAIAFSATSEFQPISGTERTEVIQPPEKIGQLVRWCGIPMSSRLRQRGLVAIKAASGNQIVTVANTHPIIFLRALSRARQVKRIGELVRTDFYTKDPLVLGGDMNHYPGPQAVDRAMQKAGGFSRVETDQPSWRIRGSKHEWAARVGALLSARQVEDFDAVLDTILYRGLTVQGSTTVSIASDHHAVIAKLSYN
jgi:endonuclease/exonuclease/phosphatase family metal-dependent hydrolase